MFIIYYRVLFQWVTVVSFENLISMTDIMSTLISVTMYWSVITAYWVQIIWQVFWWMYTNDISLWNDFPFLCNAIITKVFSHVGLSKHCRPEEQFERVCTICYSVCIKWKHFSIVRPIELHCDITCLWGFCSGPTESQLHNNERWL